MSGTFVHVCHIRPSGASLSPCTTTSPAPEQTPMIPNVPISMILNAHNISMILNAHINEPN